MSHIYLNGATDEFTKVKLRLCTHLTILFLLDAFSLFHLAHLQTIEIALQQSQNVILALGSAHKSERNIKNPFLAHEREQMILSNFSEDEQNGFISCMWLMYNDEKWVKQVKTFSQSSGSSQMQSRFDWSL